MNIGSNQVTFYRAVSGHQKPSKKLILSTKLFYNTGIIYRYPALQMNENVWQLYCFMPQEIVEMQQHI